MRHCTRPTIICLTIAAACATGTAAAEQDGVTIYGTADFAAGSAKGAGAKTAVEALDGGMDTPYYGIKAAEDLGDAGHVRVILEGFYNSINGQLGRPVPGGDTMFAREAAIEWSGSVGAVKMGRIDAPALIPTIVLNPLGGAPVLSPMFTHTFITGIGGPGPNNETAGILGGNTFTDTQWDNGLKFSLPKSTGIDAALYYEFGGDAGNPGKHNIGANFLYDIGPLKLGAYIEDNWICNPLGCLTVTVNPATTPPTVTTSATSTNILAAEEKTWFVGASYDFQVAKVYAGYNHYSLGAATQAALVFEAGNFGSTSRIPEAGVKVPVGNANVVLAWAATTTDNADGSTVRWGTTSLVYDYNFTKRTDGYVGAMQETLTDQSTGHLVALGLRHRF
jgi:predicted porin